MLWHIRLCTTQHAHPSTHTHAQLCDCSKYENAKARLEAEAAAAAEEQRILDLWYAEEAAQKLAQEAADKRAHKARTAAQMAEDNRRQLQLKVRERENLWEKSGRHGCRFETYFSLGPDAGRACRLRAECYKLCSQQPRLPGVEKFEILTAAA